MFRIRFAVGLSLALATLAPASAEDLVIPGTGDGLDMLRDVGAAYTARNPGTLVVFPPSIGSPGGRIAVFQDRAMLARIAVPISAADEATGIVAVPIVRVPTAFFTHPTLRVSNLTAEQVADIFAGKIRSWNEVGGPDLRIKVVRREEADSTLQVLRATMRGWKNLVITDRSKTAVTTQEAFDALREVEGSIGFGPYSKNTETEFTVIKVDGHHPTSLEYPSFTTIRLIFKRARITDAAKSFVKFAKSREAASIFARYGGIPENPENF